MRARAGQSGPFAGSNAVLFSIIHSLTRGCRGLITSQSDTASRKQSLEGPGPRRESTHEGSLLLVPLTLGALMLALVLGAGVPPRH